MCSVNAGFTGFFHGHLGDNTHWDDVLRLGERIGVLGVVATLEDGARLVILQSPIERIAGTVRVFETFGLHSSVSYPAAFEQPKVQNLATLELATAKVWLPQASNTTASTDVDIQETLPFAASVHVVIHDTIVMDGLVTPENIVEGLVAKTGAAAWYSLCFKDVVQNWQIHHHVLVAACCAAVLLHKEQVTLGISLFELALEGTRENRRAGCRIHRCCRDAIMQRRILKRRNRRKRSVVALDSNGRLE